MIDEPLPLLGLSDEETAEFIKLGCSRLHDLTEEDLKRHQELTTKVLDAISAQLDWGKES